MPLPTCCGIDVLVGGSARLAEGGRVQPALVGERRLADVGIGRCGGRLTSSATSAAHRGEPLEAPLGGSVAMPIFSVEVGDAASPGCSCPCARRSRSSCTCTCVAPPITAAMALGTAQPVSFWVWMPICSPARSRPTTSRTMRLDLVGQRPAVGVAQHQAVGPVGGGRLEHPQRELGVALVAVEEVLARRRTPAARRPSGRRPTPPPWPRPPRAWCRSASSTW